MDVEIVARELSHGTVEPPKESIKVDKRAREDDQDIPFEGPSSRGAWTGGVPPSVSFGIRILDSTKARENLPEGRTWEPYDMGDQMALRPAGDMSISQWACMGFWRKNLFGMLFALSARVPDFAIAAYWSDATSEMALVVQKEDSIFVEEAHGPSKTKAKQAVADQIIHSADVWKWIRAKYNETGCDQYLAGAQPAVGLEKQNEPPKEVPMTRRRRAE